MSKSNKSRKSGVKNINTGLETKDNSDWRTKPKGGYCCPTETVFPTLNPKQELRAQELITIQQSYFNKQKK